MPTKYVNSHGKCVRKYWVICGELRFSSWYVLDAACVTCIYACIIMLWSKVIAVSLTVLFLICKYGPAVSHALFYLSRSPRDGLYAHADSVWLRIGISDFTSRLFRIPQPRETRETRWQAAMRLQVEARFDGQFARPYCPSVHWLRMKQLESYTLRSAATCKPAIP